MLLFSFSILPKQIYEDNISYEKLKIRHKNVIVVVLATVCYPVLTICCTRELIIMVFECRFYFVQIINIISLSAALFPEKQVLCLK